MPLKYCAVNGCSYNAKKLEEILSKECFYHKTMTRKECSCEPPYDFYPLPKSDDLQRQWKAALNRKTFPKPENFFVCSFHFVDRKPSEHQPVPQLLLGYEKKVNYRRKLNRRDSSEPVSEKRKKESGHADQPAAGETPPPVESRESVEILDGTTLSTPTLTTSSTGSSDVKKKSIATQWEDPSLHDHMYSINPSIRRVFCSDDKELQVGPEKTDCGVQTTVADTIYRQLILSDKDALTYTGIPLDILNTLIECLKPHGNSSFCLDVSDQILLTLMKLRLNLLQYDLAKRFGISVSVVSRIIGFWIDKLAEHLSDLVIWLPREQIQATMPDSFKQKYPRTTCIIDCAETLLEKPSNLNSRGETYSNYKSYNSCKYLVAIAPCGLIMFLSRTYGGRTSDKFITQDCGLLEYLLPGDEVMADRGFVIEDLLFERRVKLNMPAFSHGKQFSEEEVNRTRKIASVRVHVERAIRRLKVFKILSHRIPITLVPQIDKILVICGALVNLLPQLITDTDLQ